MVTDDLSNAAGHVIETDETTARTSERSLRRISAHLNQLNHLAVAVDAAAPGSAIR